LRELPFDVGVALAYGALAFALAPLIGGELFRYMTEAFPAFWMAGFVILYRSIGDKIAHTAQFAALTMAAVWTPALLGGWDLVHDRLDYVSLTTISAALVIVLALDLCAYRVVASSARRSEVI